MNKHFAVFLCVCALAVGGCSHSDTSAGSAASPSPDAAATASAEPAAASAAAASPVAAAEATASPFVVSYTDIKGVNGEKEIGELEQIGVLDATPTFDPSKPILRREFVRWLFKANNALFADDPTKQIRPADGSEPPAFTDVPSTDPDFKYIQGVNDAGVTVGFPDKTFKPDQPLTREQMIAIKTMLDHGGIIQWTKSDQLPQAYATLPWTDRQSIYKIYVFAIANDVGDNSAHNVGRTFGTITVLRPKLPVTRAQAAVVMDAIGNHGNTLYMNGGIRTVASVLAKPSPAP